MARILYEHDVAAWAAKDELANPTPVQAALAAEGRAKAELLMRSGWASLSAYVRSEERDIAEGRREPPKLQATSSETGAAMLSTGSTGPLSQRASERDAFDAEWQEVEAARAKYRAKSLAAQSGLV